LLRGLVIAAALGAASAAAAQAEPKSEPRWFADLRASEPAAKWGIPESNAVGFTVSCRGDGLLEVRPALFAITPPDVVPDIRFMVDGEAYVRQATLDFSERDTAWQASALVAPDDEVIDALRRGEEVTYDFDPPLREGDAFTLSLSGSAKAIDEVLEEC